MPPPKVTTENQSANEEQVSQVEGEVSYEEHASSNPRTFQEHRTEGVEPIQVRVAEHSKDENLQTGTLETTNVISPFGLMIHNIAGHITIDKIKHICTLRNMKPGEAEKFQCGLDLLLTLKEESIFDETNLRGLEVLLQTVGLVRATEEIKKYEQLTGQSGRPLETRSKELSYLTLRDKENAPCDDNMQDVEETKSFDHFLQKLGIDVNKKLRLTDILTIKGFAVTNRYSHDSNTTVIDKFFSLITCYDHRLQFDVLAPQNDIKKEPCATQGFEKADDTDHVNEDDNCDDDWVSDDAGEVFPDVPCDQISLRDVVYAIISSVDPFLLQEVLLRLSACQKAIPILMPSQRDNTITFLLWGLRKITKSWFDRSKCVIQTENAVNYPFLTVCALRFSTVSLSKSNILNKLLGPSQSNDEHSYFISREQDPVRPVWSKGVLEATWFLPNDDLKKDQIPQAMCVFNLRGDALEFQCQTDFAIQNSFATILFIDSESVRKYKAKVDDIMKNSNVLLVLCSAETAEKQIKPMKPIKKPRPTLTKVYASGLTPLEVSKLIAKTLKQLINGNETFQRSCLNNVFNLCEKLGIQVDELRSDCAKGKHAAKEVTEHIMKHFPSLCKDKIFPVQECWKQWVKDSSKYECAIGDLEKLNAERNERVKTVRAQQLSADLSPAICKFYECIFWKERNRQYFLEWLQIFLNDVSLITLKPLFSKLKMIANDKRIVSSKIKYLRSILESMQSGAPKLEKDELEKLEKHEGDISKEKLEIIAEFDEKSLGLEHFFRELAQLSESYFVSEIGNQEKIANISCEALPSIAAEMLLSGYPIELLDGDGNNVPLKWLKEVFRSVENMKGGNTRIYVISILGIQSSGKSTLLNAMFGVRFAVSAGRCTRGAFLQLLPVHNSLKEAIGCDFVAIIDTEGLKAPEKAAASTSTSKDNALATFSLCVSDLTLINIGGQAVGEDITNILQIAAHAFIRMALVNLKSECRIIQQFVADVTAEEENEASMQSITIKLDEAIREAARKEGKSHLYRQFTDAFMLQNVESGSQNVQYIPSLWRAFMAAPNHQYGVSVQLLKSVILSSVKRGRSSTISDLFMRISDVWNAVRKEDFVFSFQNTKEFSLYETFMALYRSWVVPIRSEIMEKRLAAGVGIENATEEEMFLFQQNSIKDIKAALNTKCQELHVKIEETLREEKYKDILKHEVYFRSDLRTFENETLSNVITELGYFSGISRSAKKKDPIVKEITTEMYFKVNRIASKFRTEIEMEVQFGTSSLSDHETFIRETFEKHWEKWMEPLKAKYPLRNIETIENDILVTIKKLIFTETNKTSLKITEYMKAPLSSYSLSSSNVWENFDLVEKFGSVLSTYDGNVNKNLSDLTQTVKKLAENISMFSERIKTVLKEITKFVQESSILVGHINFYLYACSVYVSTAHRVQCKVEVEALLENKEECKLLYNNQVVHRSDITGCLCKMINSVLEASFTPQEVFDISEALKDQMKVKNDLKQKPFKTDWFLDDETKVETWVHPFMQKVSHSLQSLARNSGNCVSTVKCIKEYAVLVVDHAAYMNSPSIPFKDRAKAILLAIDYGNVKFGEYFEQFLRDTVSKSSYKMKFSKPFDISTLKAKINLVVRQMKQESYHVEFRTFLGEFNESNIEKYSSLPSSVQVLQMMDSKFMHMLAAMPTKDLTDIHNTVNNAKRNLVANKKGLAPFNPTLFSKEIAVFIHNEKTEVFTNEVKCAAVVHVGAWVVPIRAAQLYEYEKGKNVVELIEKEKLQLEMFFRGLCSEHKDKIVAQIFCKWVLEPAVRKGIFVKVTPLLFEKLSNSYTEFIRKKTFIGKVLEDLCQKDDFQGLLNFLRNFSDFGKTWTLKRIAQVCNKPGDSLIKETTLACLVEFITQMKNAVAKTQEDFQRREGDVFQNWLRSFFTLVLKETTISFNSAETKKIQDCLSVSKFDVFSEECIDVIEDMMTSILDTLDLPTAGFIKETQCWLLKKVPTLHIELFQSFSGCKMQCPFCGTVCDDPLKEHAKHTAALHYPQGINGRRLIYTNKLETMICTSAVESENGYRSGRHLRRFKYYETDFPDWYIRGVKESEPTDFWKYMFAKFNNQFAEMHMCKPGDVPNQWNNIGKQRALESLKTVYHFS